MSHRSWFPSLRSRLEPDSRQRRRNRRAKHFGKFEQLEMRALLTNTLPVQTPTFNIVNHSQFGSGNAFVSSGDYFLGVKNFDTGTHTIGGFVDPPIIGKTGVQASVDLNGTAGLDLGYYVNSGSFSASYGSSLSQSFDDPTAIGNVAVNTGVSLNNGTLTTQSPSFGAYADADLSLGGHISVNASAFGDDAPSINKTFGSSVNQELFSLNRNNDQSLNILGQPYSVGHTFSVQVNEVPPMTIDTSVQTTNSPLGAQEDMSVALEQADEENTGTGNRESGGNQDENGGGDGASVSFHLGSASQSVPSLNLSTTQTDDSGTLSAHSTDGDSGTQLASMQMEMGALAAAELGLPPGLTTMELSAGPATVDFTPLSLQLGPAVYAHQAVSATPVTTITYVFDRPAQVQVGAAAFKTMSQVTFTPGEALNIKFEGTPIHVTPYLNLDLQFHNQINIDVSVNANLTIGEISATLSDIPQTVQNALGLPYTLGPLYQHNFDLADAPEINVYDQTFDVLQQSQALAPFTIGGNFQPTLKVATTNDSSASDPAVTLRDAVNSANFLAAKNGTNEGPDVIVLGPGTYFLTDQLGQGDTDDGIKGNLLVSDPNLTIIGAGQGQTVIDASGLSDDAFEVVSGGGLHLEDLTISGGNASSGGGIFNSGALMLDHVELTNNYATFGGGIFSLGGQTTIANSNIHGNTAGYAGAALANQNANTLIENSSLDDNTASGDGGAISDHQSITTIVGTTISGNSAAFGGAIGSYGGQLIATDDFFKLNKATDPANGQGGAIYIGADGSNTATLTGSTFADNTSATQGGAISDGHEGSGNVLTITNCTFVGNLSNKNGGGALAMLPGVTATVTNSTIAGNTAKVGGGGGIFVLNSVNGASATLHNDIIANNLGPANSGNGVSDIEGHIFSLGHNLVGNWSDATGLLTGNDLEGDPQLGPLQDNGGSTPTMALLAGSPAIDAGDDNNAPANDQRGFARPSGTHNDIGAIEFIHSPLVIPDFSDDNVTVSGSTVTQNITLRDAVTMFNAQGGTNEIDLLAGTYALTASATDPAASGDFGNLVVQNEDLTIVGAGPGQTIIDASALGDRAFQVLASGHLHLIGVTITGGNSAGNGGAIENEGTLSLSNSAVTGSAAAHGGAIYNASGASLTLDGATLSGNSANRGGALYASGSVSIANSAIDDNTAPGGGGIWFENATSATITDSSVSHNIADPNGEGGGGAISVAGPLSIVRSTFDGNVAGLDGGAITTDPSSALLSISQSTFSNNIAQWGGALFSNSAVTIDKSTLTHNFAQVSPGQPGFLNDPKGLGGAIFNSQADAANGGPLTVTNSTFVGNQAIGGSGAQGSGGVLFNQAGSVALTNDTLVDNAASGGQGGVAGGVDVIGGNVTAHNTVVARNTASQNPDVSGAFTSGGQNLIGNIGSATGFVNLVNGDHVGGAPHIDPNDSTKTIYDAVIDPKLGPLQNNGGPTLTEAPLAGSPLIDAGGNSGVSPTDQSGGKRVIGGVVDIGAVENQSLYVNTTQDKLGVRSLRQAVVDADALGGQQTITLAAGTYTLSAIGDHHLDVHDVAISIVGAGAGQTIIDASAANDHAFKVARDASLNLSGMTIENGNGRDGDGGDILNGGTLIVSQSELKGGSAVRGGAIANESGASLTIDSSAIDGNASSSGGGVYNAASAMTITNSTIAGNTASLGGGVYAASPVAGIGVTLLNDTIAGNQATQGSGVYSGSGAPANPGTISLKNTIVAGNQDVTVADVAGIFLSQGHNLIGDVGAASGFTASGDQVGGASNAAIDPKLGPLQDNGGPTFTMLPAADSPAVDAGDNNGAPSVDQRGIQRPLGGTVDIGAVEEVFLTVTRFDDGNLPGQLRRVIRDANDLGGSHTISLPAGPYHLTVQGANEDGNLTGDLNILSNITLVGAGADQTIIDASGLGDRAFHVEPNSTLNLSGVTIQGGAASGDGGAVFNDHGTLIIRQSELKDNAAASGGAVANLQSPSANPQNPLLVGNFAVASLANATSGIDAATSTLAVADASQFPTTLPYTIQIDQEQLTVTDVAGNILFVTRGVDGTTAAPHDLGAAVSVVGGAASTTLTAINSKIKLSDIGLFPAVPGFLIQIDSELMQVVGVSSADNSFTVVRGVNGTSAAAHQAGAKVGLVSLAIDSSTLDGNNATSAGGAVYNLGGMTITNSTLANNTASMGGGISNDAQAKLDPSFGGATSFIGGLVTLTNDTIAGNQANSVGGIDSLPTGAGNLGAVQLHNSIVATNSDSAGNPDVSGVFVSLGHNLIGNVGAASGFTAGSNGDQIGNALAPIDPLLSPLRDNGGPLPTMALLSGSPALDVGADAGAPVADERGILRNQGAHVDIGAYELAYDLEVDLPGGGTQSLFTDLGNGLTQMSSPNGAFQTYTFENPSHSLTIISHLSRGVGGDEITLGSLEPGFAVGIMGNSHGDTIRLLSGSVLNPIGGETILSGDTLAGVGTVATPLTIDAGATLAPDAADPLTVASSLTLNPGSHFIETINGADSGSGYDQVVVTGSGTINLDGATLDASRLASFVPELSDTFTLISNQTGNPIVGTFAGLPEGQEFEIGGVPFKITYQGGGGNDVVLRVAAPEATGATIAATEGVSFDGTVATFTDADPSAVAGDYSATITWGDGSTSNGFISGTPDAGFTVTGATTYAEEGSYAVNVMIDHHGVMASAASSASVLDAPLTAGALTPPTAVEGQAFGPLTVFHFTDANPKGEAGDYTATVNTGDATLRSAANPGNVTIVPNGDGFDVQLAYTYAEEMNGATFSVSVSDVGGQGASQSINNFSVADAPLIAGAFTPPEAVEGIPFSGTVLHFTDADPGANWFDYTATVTMGDGSVVALAPFPSLNGVIVPNYSQGGFDVNVSHTYAEEMTGATFTVVVRDAGGSSISESGAFNVADAPLIAGAFTPPAAVEGIPFSGTVLHFTDADPGANWFDYTATVTMGDGDVVALAPFPSLDGVIVPNFSQGGFDVNVSHTYAEEMTGATFTVVVRDAGGSSISESGAFNVADAPLTAGLLTPPVATEGQAFGPLKVFHFSDADPNGPAGDYTATVNTGDATLNSATNPSNVAIVANSSGGFDVQLSYTYAEEMNGATFSVSVSDAGGSSASASASFDVADAPLTAGLLTPPAAAEGQAFGPLTVFHFTDADPNGDAGDYTATVNTGDATLNSATNPGNVAIVANSSDGFDVQLSYTYAEEMNGATFSVSVSDAGGSSASASASFDVADAPLTAGLLTPPVATEGQAFGPLTVFSFTDADPNGEAGDYTATINTGDATLSSAANPDNVAIVANSSGGFDVQLSYTYADELSGATFSALVVDDGGQSASQTSGDFSVADAPLSASGVNIKPLDGIATGQNTVVATFIDEGGPELVSDYGATIDWGDGSGASPGTIVPNADGSFSVVGNHTYAGVGSFPISVSITHENGITAAASSTATVDFGGGLLVLDPTGLGALSELGSGTIEVISGDIRVDSSSPAAIVAVGNGTISASDLMVTGKPGVFTLGKPTIEGPVESGLPALADPLAGVVAPTPSQQKPLPAVHAHGTQHITLDPGAYLGVQLSGNAVATLNPGTYIGGIQVSGHAAVTLNPGTYYIEGGGLSVSGNAVIAGNGVTIYNGASTANNRWHDSDDDAISISGNGALQLSAPTSGPLKNIAVFQDRASSAPILIGGNASVQVTGIVYAAAAPLVVSGGAQVSIDGDSSLGLLGASVCDDVSVIGDALLEIDVPNAPVAGIAPTAAAAATSQLGGSSNQSVQSQALESYFQNLADPSNGDELAFWALGVGQGDANDGVWTDR